SYLCQPRLPLSVNHTAALRGGWGQNPDTRTILPLRAYANMLQCFAVIMYVPLPMPLMFFAGSDGYSLLSESGNSWANATKFLAGASAIGSIAIPAILKHAGVISWGALAMELSSYFVFVLAIMFYIRMNNDNDYSFF
ncbi:hypothetical protein Goari_020276, partial [Gossypium aridum]|nr:hypothetical protein [Gossypium aridum]